MTGVRTARVKLVVAATGHLRWGSDDTDLPPIGGLTQVDVTEALRVLAHTLEPALHAIPH